MGKDQLSSGLPDDFDGKIVDCAFIHDAKYAGGAILLASFTIERLDGEGEVEQRYSFPRGWTDIGGQTATHENGNTKVNNRSQYGEFCARAFNLLPADVESGVDLLSAKSWVGLTFHWDRISEHKEWTDATTGEARSADVERLQPTSYIAEATSAASPSLVTLSGGGYAVSVPEELASSVKALATSVPYAAFAQAVYALPGGVDHEDLVTAVADEAFYNGLK